MNTVFRIVYLMLKWTSTITGLSYNEINIVVYYFFLPAILLLLVDRINKRYILTPLLVTIWALLLLSVPNFSRFSDRAFDASVVFLNGFSVIGWNYIVASVMVCVVAPALAFAVLFYYAFPQFFRRHAKDAS